MAWGGGELGVVQEEGGRRKWKKQQAGK